MPTKYPILLYCTIFGEYNLPGTPVGESDNEVPTS